ncbi:DUF4889 domain-containing protein, partial [Staphylococcus epidermidis]|uniref:DUF4889 domain-containing protein n=1 Tax=Staphylococcus epidermidis TaxID=1282 RepID=UPI0037D9AE91
MIIFLPPNKHSYYPIIKHTTTIHKIINTKNQKIQKNLQLPKHPNLSVKKEHFLILFKHQKTPKITKLNKVHHHHLPHPLISKIHHIANIKHP